MDLNELSQMQSLLKIMVHTPRWSLPNSPTTSYQAFYCSIFSNDAQLALKRSSACILHSKSVNEAYLLTQVGMSWEVNFLSPTLEEEEPTQSVVTLDVFIIFRVYDNITVQQIPTHTHSYPQIPTHAHLCLLLFRVNA